MNDKTCHPLFVRTGNPVCGRVDMMLAVALASLDAMSLQNIGRRRGGSFP